MINVFIVPICKCTKEPVIGVFICFSLCSGGMAPSGNNFVVSHILAFDITARFARMVLLLSSPCPSPCPPRASRFFSFTPTALPFSMMICSTGELRNNFPFPVLVTPRIRASTTAPLPPIG